MIKMEVVSVMLKDNNVLYWPNVARRGYMQGATTRPISWGRLNRANRCTKTDVNRPPQTYKSICE